MSASRDDATNQSTETFITALVVGLVTLGAEVAIFMTIKNRFRKIYNPRSYLVAPKKRHEPLPSSFLGWIPAILRYDARDIITKNGLDAYVFVRFLWLMCEMFLPFWILSWIILLPVNAANSNGNNTGLEMFTFGNVGETEQPRYAAHLILVWIFTFYVFYLIKREYAAYIILRQDFLMSREHAMLAQSRTVLVTGVPKEFLTVDAMTRFCSVLPGGVKRVWMARNLDKMPDLYERRQKACSKLESAENKLLKLAAKAIAKENKKNSKGKDQDLPTHVDQDKGLIERYVPAKKRPSHKLGFLGLFGKKVDSIEWAREEIATTTRELEEARGVLNGPEGNTKYPAETAAFIQFNQQIAAHMFAQCLNHHAPLRMAARYLEVAQEDVIWSNLNINPYQAKLRYVASWAATVGLIVGWAFPVAFVGLISNVSALCLNVSWMAWLCTLPTPVNGIIQGALPPIALAVLFILLPIILRLFARLEGIPLKTGIELSLMTRYFMFLFIHGFIIVTLASGLVNSIPGIVENPSSAVTILATQLPSASIFFLTYIVTTSFAGAAGALLQIVPLILYYVKLFILGSTPRSVYNIKYQMNGVAWGTLFPNMTLLTVIGLAYSIIAPLINGFAFVAFFLYWFVYKYLFLLVIDCPPASETGGLFYPKALTHIFAGLYIEELCLCGLFFLAVDENGKHNSIAQGALMVVLIVLTIFFQITMLSGYKPLVQYLPLSVAGRLKELQTSDGSPSTSGPVDTRFSVDEKQPRTNDPRFSVDEKRDASLYPPTTLGGRSEDNVPFTKNGGDYSNHGTLPGEEHVDKHAFDHPATYEGYPTVWIPEDHYGYSKAEVQATRSAGVDASSDGARMDDKGKTDVSRAPPGEDWDETQEL
ncbi:phosphate metabolism protein 7 [Microbotryomycetes sp. JL221]|nr:phosphate metabolism protein 7 [Microbotryomycetes sp. JL221]